MKRGITVLASVCLLTVAVYFAIEPLKTLFGIS